MHHASHLDDVLIFLLAAVVVVSIFRWFKASSILGYLIAGILIGPYALGFIDEIEGVKSLGEVGVVFLLFSIGLKMPLQRLQVLRRYVFGLGFTQVFLTGTLIALAAWVFNLEPITAILVGSGLALSSTAVALQVLAEKGEASSRYGRVSFAVLLFQDLAVVVLIVLLYSLDRGEASIPMVLGLAALKASAVLVGIILIGRILLRPLFRIVASFNNQELFVATSLLVVLSTSVLTANAGLSKELGAFLAGILLSETEYRHQVEADIQPFHGLLLGLFFMTVGMGVDLNLFINNFLIILGIIVSLVVSKAAILFGLCRVFRIPTGSSVRVGLLLASGGEFVFILFAPAMQMGFIPESQGLILFVAVALSMGLTPLLGALGRYIDSRISVAQADSNLQSAEEEIGDLRNHIIIAGFGRVGRIVAEILSQRMVPFVAIDNNMSRVSAGRAAGYPVYFGDARRSLVMRTLGAHRARAVVVSLNNQAISMRTTMMLRRNFPNAETYVRMRDNEYEEKLTQAGAIVIMPENLEPSLQLAASAMRVSGTTDDEISQILNDFRRQYKSLNTIKEDSETNEKSMNG